MTYEELKKVFGSNVKKYRRKAGIKLCHFALELDVWENTVHLIEVGERFPRFNASFENQKSTPPFFCLFFMKLLEIFSKEYYNKSIKSLRNE